jgi:hypothetical protein
MLLRAVGAGQQIVAFSYTRSTDADAKLSRIEMTGGADMHSDHEEHGDGRIANG